MDSPSSSHAEHYAVTLVRAESWLAASSARIGPLLPINVFGAVQRDHEPLAVSLTISAKLRTVWAPSDHRPFEHPHRDVPISRRSAVAHTVTHTLEIAGVMPATISRAVSGPGCGQWDFREE